MSLLQKPMSRVFGAPGEIPRDQLIASAERLYGTEGKTIGAPGKACRFIRPDTQFVLW